MLKSHLSKNIFCYASLFALVACDDNPIIGTWEAPKPDVCIGAPHNDSELDVDNNLEIDGHIWFVGEQYCHYCEITGDFDEDADDPYKADVNIFLSETCLIECNGRGDAECDMDSNEDKIKCELSVGPCSQLTETFEKTSD